MRAVQGGDVSMHCAGTKDCRAVEHTVGCERLAPSSSHDNQCQYCGHPSNDGHHYVVLVRGAWYWGCGDGPRDGIDMSIRIGHRVPEGEIRCP